MGAHQPGPGGALGEPASLADALRASLAAARGDEGASCLGAGSVQVSLHVRLTMTAGDAAGWAETAGVSLDEVPGDVRGYVLSRLEGAEALEGLPLDVTLADAEPQAGRARQLVADWDATTADLSGLPGAVRAWMSHAAEVLREVSRG